MSRKYWIVGFVIPLVLVLSFLVFQLTAEIKKRQAGGGYLLRHIREPHFIMD